MGIDCNLVSGLLGKSGRSSDVIYPDGSKSPPLNFQTAISFSEGQYLYRELFLELLLDKENFSCMIKKERVQERTVAGPSLLPLQLGKCFVFCDGFVRRPDHKA